MAAQVRVREEKENDKGVGGKMWARRGKSREEISLLHALRFQGNTMRNDYSVSPKLKNNVGLAHKLIGCRCIVYLYTPFFLCELIHTD